MIYEKQNQGSKSPRNASQLAGKLRYALTGQSDLCQPLFQPTKVRGAPHCEWFPQPQVFFFQNPHGWASAMASEFERFTHEVRAGRKPPTHLFDHHTVSFSPDDQVILKKRLKSIDPMFIVKEALWEGAFCDRPHVIVMHHDTPHLNAHIYISMCDLRGKIYRQSYDYRHFEFLMEVIEQTYGLAKVHARRVMAKTDPSRLPAVKAMTANEVRMAERTGRKSIRVELQEHLDAALGAKTFPEFVEYCVANEIGVMPFRMNHAILGLTYWRGGEAMRASDLGAKYGWPSLVEQFAIDMNNLNHRRALGLLEQVAVDMQTVPCTIAPKQMMSGGTQHTPPIRLTKLTKARTSEGTQYRWKRNGALAFTDRGSQIQLHTRTKTTVARALQLAISKGWSELIVKGTQAVKEMITTVWAKLGPKQSVIQEASPAVRVDRTKRESELPVGHRTLLALGAKRSIPKNDLNRSKYELAIRGRDVLVAGVSSVVQAQSDETVSDDDVSPDTKGKSRRLKP